MRRATRFQGQELGASDEAGPGIARPRPSSTAVGGIQGRRSMWQSCRSDDCHAMGRASSVRSEDGVTVGSNGDTMTRSGETQGDPSSKPSMPLGKAFVLAVGSALLLALSLVAIARPLLAEGAEGSATTPSIARGLPRLARNPGRRTRAWRPASPTACGSGPLRRSGPDQRGL